MSDHGYGYTPEAADGYVPDAAHITLDSNDSSSYHQSQENTSTDIECLFDGQGLPVHPEEDYACTLASGLQPVPFESNFPDTEVHNGIPQGYQDDLEGYPWIPDLDDEARDSLGNIESSEQSAFAHDSSAGPLVSQDHPAFDTNPPAEAPNTALLSYGPSRQEGHLENLNLSTDVMIASVNENPQPHIGAPLNHPTPSNHHNWSMDDLMNEYANEEGETTPMAINQSDIDSHSTLTSDTSLQSSGNPTHSEVASQASSGVLSDPLECPEGCGATFRGGSRKSNMSRHRRHKHEGLNSPCDSCGQVFIRSDALRNHQRRGCRT